MKVAVPLEMKVAQGRRQRQCIAPSPCGWVASREAIRLLKANANTPLSAGKGQERGEFHWKWRLRKRAHFHKRAYAERVVNASTILKPRQRKLIKLSVDV